MILDFNSFTCTYGAHFCLATAVRILIIALHTPAVQATEVNQNAAAIHSLKVQHWCLPVLGCCLFNRYKLADMDCRLPQSFFPFHLLCIHLQKIVLLLYLVPSYIISYIKAKYWHTLIYIILIKPSTLASN